jgi:hypothetical protein
LPTFFAEGLAGKLETAEGESTSTKEPFSSVFRASSPRLQLWTHYDITDNILCHVYGTKVTLIFALV